MPIRVKSYARGDSRDSLTSTDHLIAVYSLESKDPSFEACGGATTMPSCSPQPTFRGGPTSTGEKGATAATSSHSNNKDSGSWMKGPWSVYFPPQLQMNVQQISERLKLEPTVNSKLAQHHAAVVTPSAASRNSGKSSSTGTVSAGSNIHNKNATASSSTTSTRQKHKSTRRQDSEGSCGYDIEHKEDVEGNGNICILPLEQSAAFTGSDDESVSSWSSQAAVKFNKKLKPKVADHGLATNANATATAASSMSLADPAVNSWEHAWGTKPSLTYSKSMEADIVPPEHRTPKDSTSKDNSLAVNMEKRDESELECPAPERPEEGQPTTQEGVTQTAGPRTVTPSPKKSVRFTDPLVTSQYFRPRTRPEEVSMLFFDEDELELLEEDRETTSRDQFEMIAQELSENRLRISIAYQNRWRDHQRRRQSANNGSLQVATSASDI